VFGGWEVWVHAEAAILYYVYVSIVGSTVSYYVGRNFLYMYTYIIYVHSVQNYTRCGFYSIVGT